jgi:hypothetical protein
VDQLPIDFSRQLGEAGMQRTLEAEREEWIVAAMEGIRQFAAMPGWHEFKMEDFRAWFEPQRGKPHSANVYGALTNRARRDGLIVWTGKFAGSVSPKTHGHYVRIWRVA